MTELEKVTEVTKLDYTARTVKPEVEGVCEEIQASLTNVVSHAESVLHSIRNKVRGNRVAIDAELGANNAKAFAAVYTGLQYAVETAKDIKVEDLPS